MSLSIKSEVIGLADTLHRFRHVEPLKLRQVLVTALYENSERIMTQAKLRTPVDTGNLRASGHVTLPQVTGEQVGVELAFGGPSGAGESATEVGYAYWVHERKAPGGGPVKFRVGQSQFLRTVVLQWAKNAAEHLLPYLEAAFGRGRSG